MVAERPRIQIDHVSETPVGGDLSGKAVPQALPEHRTVEVGIVLRSIRGLPSCLPASTARFSPALTRWRSSRSWFSTLCLSVRRRKRGRVKRR